MRVRVSLSRRKVRLLCIRVCAGAIAALAPVAAQAQLLPFGFPSCLNLLLLSCVANTVNVLGTTVIVRRNDILLGLDLGLDRQIDILSFPNGEYADAWPEPSGLGGWSRPASSDGEFPAPYALGASPRTDAPVRRPFALWAEGSFSRFNEDSGPFGTNGHSGVVYVGADYRLSSNILVGALIQFDQTDQEFEGVPTRVSNTGWMAGLYATVRLSNNLFFQARAAWGKSQNEVRADTSVNDEFDSDRWLLRGTLLGQWQAGAWQIRPRATIGYIEESKDTYTSSNGAVIPGVTASLGQAKAGSEIAYRHRLADGTVIEPSLLLEGIWNFAQDAGSVKVDDLAAGPDVRGRAEVGVMMITRDSLSLGASVSYDGIASGDFHAIGGKVRARMPLN